MVAIQVKYEGELHCKAMHSPSGTTLTTDAPEDIQGRAESFSPTDLVAAALGSCILTVMGIVARSLRVDITGATAAVEKEMASAPMRMIRKLTVKIHVPYHVTDDQRQKLEKAAYTCPVHKSMHSDVQMPIEFIWGK